VKPGHIRADNLIRRASARGEERSEMVAWTTWTRKTAKLSAMLVVLVLATNAMAAQMGPVTQVVTPVAAAAGRDRPRLVRFFPMEGLPPDSLVRQVFMEGFDEGLATEKIETERQDAMGRWNAADSLGSRFGPSTDSTAYTSSTSSAAWTMHVVVGAPPPYIASSRQGKSGKMERHVDPNMRASRGMTLVLHALSPNEVRAGLNAAPEHLAFAFPVGAAPAGVLGDIPAGFAYPWREAGRITGLLVLEELHYRSGDLPKAARFRLPTITRVESVRADGM